MGGIRATYKQNTYNYTSMNKRRVHHVKYDILLFTTGEYSIQKDGGEWTYHIIFSYTHTYWTGEKTIVKVNKSILNNIYIENYCKVLFPDQ